MSVIIDHLPAPVKSKVPRRVCPPLGEADVVRLVRPRLGLKTGEPLASGWLPAAMVAAACCARVYYYQAVLIRVGEHWSPDGDVLIVPDAVPRPVPILPILQQALIGLFEARGKRDGMLLFANDDESPHNRRILYAQVKSMLAPLGIEGADFQRRCHAFYDRAIRKIPDPEVRFALTGPIRPTRSPDPPPYDVPLPTLRRELFERHPLNGPAGRYLDERGRKWMEERAEEQNLPERPRIRGFHPSEAFLADPVVMAMKQVAWPRDLEGEEAQDLRLDLKKKHFPHVDELRKAKKLRFGELVFLYRATSSQIRNWVNHRRVRAAKSEVAQRPVLEWQEMFLGEYLARAAGESAHAVYVRFCRQHRCAKDFSTFERFLKRTGAFKRRRGRPRKRPKR